VVNARFVKPLDRDLIVEVAKRVRYMVTVKKAARWVGSAQLCSALSEGGVTHVMTKVRGYQIGLSSKDRRTSRERYGLTAEGIYQA
jgi:1-deoxy-D-xylulose-5-phosphate synthase